MNEKHHLMLPEMQIDSVIHTHTVHIIFSILSSARTVTHLVTSPPALSDDLGHVVNLSLRTAECAELLCVSVVLKTGR